MITVTKVVKKYGNSGGVYVPNAWIGGKVKVELIDEPFSVNDVLNKVAKEHVVSAILYGSHARNEASEGSDIDIILVRDKNSEIDIPDELKQKYDIQVKTTEEAMNAMAHDPIFYKIIKDKSVAMINHQFLESLRKIKLKSGSIKTRLTLAESSLNITKEIFNLGNNEVVYPLIMRLKEMMVLECLLSDKKYSTAMLKNEILSCGLSPKEFLCIIKIYRVERSNKKSESVSRETIKKLISLLEMKIKYVKQKTVEKGH